MPRIIKPAKGTFTSATVTVDSSGRVVAASSGAGAANMVLTKVDAAPSSGSNGTFTATNNTSKIIVYMRGGGGASGNLSSPGTSGSGGNGGFGVLATPISQPFSVPYALGARGNQGVANSPGNAGTASTFNTNFVANGGGGGSRGGSPGAGGSMGTVTGSSNAIELSTPGNVNGNPGDGNPATAMAETINSYMAEPIINSIVDIGSAQGANATPGSTRALQAGVGGVKNTSTTGNNGIAGGIKIYEDIG